MNIPKLPEKPKLNVFSYTYGPIVNSSAVSSFGFGGSEPTALNGTSLAVWYSELEAWHKSVFEGAVEVGCVYLKSVTRLPEPDNPKRWWASESICPSDTHTALLIQITPIKEETAEDILKEIVETLDIRSGAQGGLMGQPKSTLFEVDVLKKAKVFLARKK